MDETACLAFPWRGQLKFDDGARVVSSNPSALDLNMLGAWYALHVIGFGLEHRWWDWWSSRYEPIEDEL